MFLRWRNVGKEHVCQLFFLGLFELLWDRVNRPWRPKSALGHWRGRLRLRFEVLEKAFLRFFILLSVFIEIQGRALKLFSVGSLQYPACSLLELRAQMAFDVVVDGFEVRFMLQCLACKLLYVVVMDATQMVVLPNLGHSVCDL